MNNKVNKLSQILITVIVIAVVAGMSSCEKNIFTPITINPVDSLHFQADIQPIFSTNCLSCHGPLKAPDLRDGKAYAALSKLGLITPPAETSLLYLEMIGSDHAPRSSDAEKQKVRIWINQGAHNN